MNKKCRFVQYSSLYSHCRNHCSSQIKKEARKFRTCANHGETFFQGRDKNMEVIEKAKVNKKIVKAHIGFSNGEFGRTITLDGSSLSWRNTISPAHPPVCDYDCSLKKVELSSVEVRLLANEILDVNLEGCVSDLNLDYPPGAIYSVFICTYDDGTEFEYITRFKPVPAFNTLKDIFDKACDLYRYRAMSPILDEKGTTTILNSPRIDGGVIQLPPNVTEVLYSDTLKLLVCSSNKTITLKKNLLKSADTNVT